MEAIAQIWVYLAERPLLWLTVTVVTYYLAHRIYHASGELALLNPVLLAVTALVAILAATGTPYAVYFDGAQFVHFMLGPATVALAVPLFGELPTLRRLWLPLTVALAVGSVTAVISALAIGYLLGLTPQTLLSLLPKSVTTPIAMGIAEKVGGLPSLTAVLVILTGITGAVIGPPLLSAIGIRRSDTRGFAMGVAAHGIGTARAFQENEKAGAFSGLGMGLNGALTAIVVPLIIWLVGM
ncbi:MAG: LrgB family protein [Ectothiorhodospiraceae bacterium]|jgi:predicted murein hydrolase (TIGR00659 family)